MKITDTKVYQIASPLTEGNYDWSNGNFVEMHADEAIARYAKPHSRPYDCVRSARIGQRVLFHRSERPATAYPKETQCVVPKPYM